MNRERQNEGGPVPGLRSGGHSARTGLNLLSAAGWLRQARGGTVRFYLLCASLFLLPAIHPIFRPLLGPPSHLLWWVHVLPVALIAYRIGFRAGVAGVAGSMLLAAVGEALFGAGYGIPADDATVWAITVALGATDLLVMGFARWVRREEEERRRSDRELRESEERYALAAEGAHDGLWDWDLTTDEMRFSPRWRRLVDAEEDGEVAADPGEWLDRVHPDDRPGLEAALENHLSGRDDHFEHEHRLRTDSGEERWVVNRGVALRRDDGTPYRMAGSMNDITARKRAEAQLAHDAMHDPLTNLPNRALFRDRLDLALRRARRDDEEHCAVLFVDLDRFKHVNESLGHEAGDEMLREIGERLASVLRPGDTIARLGGDEFALLIDEVDSVAEATHVAQRILAVLGDEIVVSAEGIFPSASVGIAMSVSGYQRADDMIRDAEIAMYRAKASGKDGYEVFDEQMHASAVALFKMETELRRAVERDEFVMHYQPILSLGDLRIVGFEALVRWLHPERGLVAPAQFIGVAEETGLIVPLGWRVLEAACGQIADWQRRFPSDPPLTVSCNVSGKLFMQPGVVERVISLLEDNSLDPSSLRLEITETVVMDHGESALQRLSELRALGVQLDIDDFGTGYSSLSYLQRFRYDTLKIDRSFVNAIGQRGDSQAIVETILALGRLLDMNVVAEGVETARQVEWLQDLDCPQGQGYWFARPQDAAGAELMLRDGPSLRPS